MDFEKLTDDRLGEPSIRVRERVEAARLRQRARFTEVGLTCNADMGPGDVRIYCQLEETGSALVRQAMNQLQLSTRAFHRMLKLARIIADLDGVDQIAPSHLAEALQYRPRRWNS